MRRIAIPHWMAAGIGADDRPERLDRNEHGERFAIGRRRYLYGRWGLAPAG